MAQMSREAFTRSALAAGLALALTHSLDGASPAMARDLGREIASTHADSGHQRNSQNAALRALMAGRHIAGVSFNRHDRPGPTGHVITIGDERVWVDYGERPRETAVDLVERAGSGMPFADLRSGIYGQDAHGSPHVIVSGGPDRYAGDSPAILYPDVHPYVTFASLGVLGMPAGLEHQRIPVFHPTRDQAVAAAHQIDRTISRDDLDLAYTDAALNRVDRTLSDHDREL
jgi:hypothetical protein